MVLDCSQVPTAVDMNAAVCWSGFAFVPFPSQDAAASCAGPMITVGTGTSTGRPAIHPDTDVVVTGRYFVKDCKDTGQGRSAFGCSSSDRDDDPYGPLTGLRLELRQGGRHWALGSADARTDLGEVRWQVRIPVGVHPGSASLVVHSSDLSSTRLPIAVRK